METIDDSPCGNCLFYFKVEKMWGACRLGHNIDKAMLFKHCHNYITKRG